MKSSNDFTSIYLWINIVDFRKSINGLSAMVQEEMELDPFSNSLFIFCCQRRKKIKILYWDRTGFALWYKRLEEDLFPWPRHLDIKTLEITDRLTQPSMPIHQSLDLPAFLDRVKVLSVVWPGTSISEATDESSFCILDLGAGANRI